MVGKKAGFAQRGSQHSRSSLPACLLPVLSAAAHFSPVPNFFAMFLCLKGAPFPAHCVFLGLEDYPVIVKGQPVASSLDILTELQRLSVMPEPCKLQSCISTKGCVFRFGKQRSGMLWGMVGKGDCMTWERTDGQARTTAFLYVIGIWMEKQTLEMTTWLPGAGDVKQCLWLSKQFKSVYLDNLQINLHKELDWQLNSWQMLI